jgi:hypothetical protein
MSFFLLLFFASLCWTQEAIKLDLNKAYELALKNNAEIKRATLELDSLDAKETEAKLFFMPRAVLGAGLIYNSKSEEWEKPFGVSFVSVLYEYRKTLPRIRSAKMWRLPGWRWFIGTRGRSSEGHSSNTTEPYTV